MRRSRPHIPDQQRVEHVMADLPQSTIERPSQEEYWNCVSLFLVGGGATLVDSDIFESLLEREWSVTVKNGAVYARAKDFLHRVIFKPGKGLQVDHHNGDGLDNRRRNLRASNHQQNQWNAGPMAGKKSMYKGVSMTRQGRWKAQIRYSKSRHYLGIFDTEEQAGRAYDASARLHHGEFARLNFPE